METDATTWSPWVVETWAKLVEAGSSLDARCQLTVVLNDVEIDLLPVPTVAVESGWVWLWFWSGQRTVGLSCSPHSGHLHWLRRENQNGRTITPHGQVPDPGSVDFVRRLLGWLYPNLYTPPEPDPLALQAVLPFHPNRLPSSFTSNDPLGA